MTVTPDEVYTLRDVLAVVARRLELADQRDNESAFELADMQRRYALFLAQEYAATVALDGQLTERQRKISDASGVRLLTWGKLDEGSARNPSP